jgi:DNA primase
VKLQRNCNSGSAPAQCKRSRRHRQKQAHPRKVRCRRTSESLSNAPLDFELKSLDRKHPYLRNRKFTDATIEEFELGFCSKGYLKNRIAIPLQDQQGRLVGYAGRIVDDNLITDEEPRYKFPGQRERETVIHDFRKSEFLYGGYRIKEPLADLIVVEGFTHHWWLWQHDIRNVVCLMGWSMSEPREPKTDRSRGCSTGAAPRRNSDKQRTV